MAGTTELEFLIDTLQIEQELADAKAAAPEVRSSDDADSPEHLRYRAAKDAARAHRKFWREVRAAIGTASAEGDATATPDAHGMGVTPQEG